MIVDALVNVMVKEEGPREKQSANQFGSNENILETLHFFLSFPTSLDTTAHCNQYPLQEQKKYLQRIQKTLSPIWALQVIMIKIARPRNKSKDNRRFALNCRRLFSPPALAVATVSWAGSGIGGRAESLWTAVLVETGERIWGSSIFWLLLLLLEVLSSRLGCSLSAPTVAGAC